MVTFSDRFACTPAQYWEMWLSAEYQSGLHLQGMGFPQYRVLERAPESWKVHVVPTALPGAVRKVLGDGGYIEEAHRDGNVWRFDIIPDTLGDRIHTAGVIRIEGDGTDGPQTLRSVEIEVTVKLMGIGRAVKKAMEAMMSKHQDAATAYTHAAIAGGMLTNEENG